MSSWTLSPLPCPFCCCFSIASVSAFSFCYSECLSRPCCLLPLWLVALSSSYLRACTSEHSCPYFSGEGQQRCFFLQFSCKTVLSPYFCPLWGGYVRHGLCIPLTAMFLPEISIVLLRHRWLFAQPTSQPSMDLQGLDLKVQLQLMANGKTGNSFILVKLCSRSRLGSEGANAAAEILWWKHDCGLV